MDKKIIDLIKQKDENAFEELYAEYKNLVYYVIYQIVKDHEVSSQLLQDTFLTVCRKIDQYQGGNFKYWIVTIAKNLSKNYLTRDLQKERRTIKDEDIIYQTIDNSNIGLGKYDSILSEYFNQEQKDIIVYHVIFEYKFNEIGEMLDKPPKYISRQYKSSLKLLKKIMENM